MEAGYQTPDFEQTELGNLFPQQLTDLLREKDWTADLMKFVSHITIDKEACPPNFNAQIDDRTAATIVPANIGRFTVIVGKRTGPKWLGMGSEFFIEDVGIQDVESILAELEQGRFAELKQKYST